MIKAYLTWISTPYEGESIEIRFRIYKNEEQIYSDSIIMDYMKPAIVGHMATIELLKRLQEHRSDEIIVIINDGSLYESIKGTSATKNKDVQMMSKKVREELSRFDNVSFDNISGNHIRLVEWNEILKP
ncbi:MAG: reverse transcriptase-like protein [Tissierella sp.]|nr:reverse transcriptase-like protein [Tissierella sp.]